MLQIGSIKLKNWLIMAPMAGITNLPFRLIVKKLGAGLVTTEMISAMGLVQGKKSALDYLNSQPDEKPLSVQIFGSVPEAMSTATKIVIDTGADIVDINMGCPVKKVVKTGSGGFLLRDLENAKRIVSAVRRACSVPLTVKIRAGWSNNQPVAYEIARMLEDCGADAITVHPRSVTQAFSGHSDWKIISKVKEQVKIPVIGNGDVFDPSMALEMKRQTGCNGVMIGRGARGNPWIFKQILELEKGLIPHHPGLDERKTLIVNHFNLLANEMGENRASRIMQGLLFWYTKGLPNNCSFRRGIIGIKDLCTLTSALDSYFSYSEATPAGPDLGQSVFT